MLFKDFLDRANCRALENFILNGGECKDTSADLPMHARLKKAEEALLRFIRLQSTNEQEMERFLDIVMEPIAELQAVFFEAGLLAGAKLAFEIRGKMDENACKS